MVVDTQKKIREFVSPSRNKRRDLDVMKLMMMTDFKVELVDKRSLNEFFVELHGPKDSDYEGGVWKIRVKLTDEYPYKSPIIEFENRIYHPNIEESGPVCLDVAEYNWTALFDLVKVFEIFLPELLLHPNPYDPINIPAATLMINDKPAFVQRVKDYIERFAKPMPVEEPCDDGNSYDPTTADNSYDPTTAHNSYDPTTAHNSNDQTTAENSDDPTTAKKSDDSMAKKIVDPTMPDKSDDPKAKKSVDPKAKKSDDPKAKKSVDPKAKKSVDPKAKKSVNPKAKKSVDPKARKYVDPKAKKSVDPKAKKSVDSTTPEKSNFPTSNGRNFDR